jgi:hemerythrin-like domain-containing protein
MHYERMLAELFSEEDRARALAARLSELADATRTSREAVAAEQGSLLAFLRGPIERHFSFEELVIFPKLVEHALGEEVQVATKQHEAVRQLTRKLAGYQESVQPGAGDELRGLIFEIARQLLHHTNFEGDYIYPELTHDEWRELMKETVAKGDSHSRGSVPTEPSVNS